MKLPQPLRNHATAHTKYQTRTNEVCISCFAATPVLVMVRALGRDKGRVDTDRLSPLQLLNLTATLLL